MLRQGGRPELLNRIDGIIVFRSLDRNQLAQIRRVLLGRVARRMRARGIKLERACADEAVDFPGERRFRPAAAGRGGGREPSSGCCGGRALGTGCSRARSSPASACGSTYANSRLNLETIPEAVVAGEECGNRRPRLRSRPGMCISTSKVKSEYSALLLGERATGMQPV